jgi:ADP-heptose:LPS heptosyltransferase
MHQLSNTAPDFCNTPGNSKPFASGRTMALQRIVNLVRRPVHKRVQRRYRLCIFKPDGIGDFVLALGAIRLLLDEFGAENCVLVCWPAVQALAEAEFPRATLVITAPFDVSLRPRLVWTAMRLRKRFGAFKFEQLVCLRHQRSRFQNLALHWIRAEKHYGLVNQPSYHLGENCEFAFNNRDAYPKNAEDGHCLELEAHRIVAERSLGRKVAGSEIMPAFGSFRRSPGNYILVSPFSGKLMKDCPLDLLVPVLAEIKRSYSAPFLLSFSPQQHDRARKLALALSQENILVDLPPPMSFAEYVQSVSTARAVLTVDTATAHIAITLGIPTVVILGGGHYGQFGPWGRSAKQVWVSNPLACFNCGWHCSQPEVYCITHIKVESVTNAMRHVLSQHRETIADNCHPNAK